MANTRFKGETAAERLDFSGISDSDMIQLRHKPGTIGDTDKGISKANLLSCPFGVSDTAAGTVAKNASLTDSNPDFSLVSGREVVVCFTTANSASTPTLNFSGSGAYPIYHPDGSAVGAWAAGTWMHLKYFSATVGGNVIQRWILLSPLPVDTVALNNMQSVTSNAVAKALQVRSGQVYTNEITGESADSVGYESVRITFDTPMPTTNYVVCFQSVSAGGCAITLMSRELGHCVINVQNRNFGTNLTFTIRYTAICLDI